MRKLGHFFEYAVNKLGIHIKLSVEIFTRSLLECYGKKNLDLKVMQLVLGLTYVLSNPVSFLCKGHMSKILEIVRIFRVSSALSFTGCSAVRWPFSLRSA